MKTVTRILLCVLLLVNLLFTTACTPDYDQQTLDQSKITTGYTAVYQVTIYNGDVIALQYTNNYTVAVQDVDGTDRLVISSIATAPYKGDEGGTQTITSESVLAWKEEAGATLGMPMTVEEEFTVSTVENKHTYLYIQHDHSLQRGTITAKMYNSKDDKEMTQHVYTLSLADQYYDKDSFPFLAAAFAKNIGYSASLLLSAGNRDKLQSVNFKVLDGEKLTLSAVDYDCIKVRIHPNSLFTNYSADIWLDATNGIPVKVQQADTTMELVSFTTNDKS